ncbi:MAG: protein kinase [Crocinitomicaceae bacterium]
MQAIDSQYEIVKRLSAERNIRFGQCFLVKEIATGNLFVEKSVEKTNSIGLEQLKNESTFSFNINGLPEILSILENDHEFSFRKKYVEGITLTDFWKNVKRRKKVATLVNVIQGLEPLFIELERQHIVHCDVKPENILIHELDGKLHCSLIDFGLAFRRDEVPARKTLFQLAYAAPEIVLNRLTCADFSSDVFSFCLVSYKLLAGNLPFTSGNPALMTQLQITYPIEKPWKIKKKIWKILEKGLQKHNFKKSPNYYTNIELERFLVENNQKRFQNFSEFAREFYPLFPEV